MADNTYRATSETNTTGQLGVWKGADVATYRPDPAINRRIRQIRPNETPYTTLLDSAGRSEPVSQMEFRWQEEHDMEMKCTTTSATAASATTVNVDTVSYLYVGHVLSYPATGETFRISSIATLALTVVRACGDCTAQPIPSGAVLLVVGTSLEEAQDKPPLLMRGTASGVLYTQHIAHALGASDWQLIRAQRGPTERERLAAQGIRYFKKLREYAAMMGNPGTGIGENSQPTYFTAGLNYFCHQKNVISLSGSTSWEGLAKACSHIYQYGESKVRYGFASTDALYRITGLPEVQNNVWTSQDTERVGFEIREIFGPFGTLRLVEHPLMNEEGMHDRILVTSIGDLKRRVFSGLDPQKDIQTPGAYREEWSLAVNEGWEHMNTYGCGVILDL